MPSHPSGGGEHSHFPLQTRLDQELISFIHDKFIQSFKKTLQGPLAGASVQDATLDLVIMSSSPTWNVEVT